MSKYPFCQSSIPSSLWNDWKWQAANRLTTLAPIFELQHSLTPEKVEAVIEQYPWGSTPYYLSLIDWSNPRDPVARQVIPLPEEIEFRLPGTDIDPLAEEKHSPCPNLVHRYRDRVLIITTGFCFSYCRHCNRKRNWKKHISSPSVRAIEKMCQYIRAHTEIREIILSGGDPLTLPLDKLDRMLHAFSKIPHIEVLRIGTRVPVVLPMRITNDLVSLLHSYRPLWLNTHFNHPSEITDEASSACEKFLMAGIPVSNQTVLLKGVNDDYETLQTLFTKLNSIMVRPYYLFHCDAVKGTDHFRISISRGIELMSRLYACTGGLSLPQYVVDLPHGGGKAPVMPSYLLGVQDNTAIFRTSEGGLLRYHGFHGADDD